MSCKDKQGNNKNKEQNINSQENKNVCEKCNKVHDASISCEECRKDEASEENKKQMD